ncbi:MAG: hypothetical protein RR547_08680 [Raoultibacter sp.]
MAATRTIDKCEQGSIGVEFAGTVIPWFIAFAITVVVGWYLYQIGEINYAASEFSWEAIDSSTVSAEQIMVNGILASKVKIDPNRITVSNARLDTKETDPIDEPLGKKDNENYAIEGLYRYKATMTVKADVTYKLIPIIRFGDGDDPTITIHVEKTRITSNVWEAY